MQHKLFTVSIQSTAAQDALEWCMYVQELLLWQHWSAHVLAVPDFKEVLDGVSGLPLFRGPRWGRHALQYNTTQHNKLRYLEHTASVILRSIIISF